MQHSYVVAVYVTKFAQVIPSPAPFPQNTASYVLPSQHIIAIQFLAMPTGELNLWE
jgi:hypothetical protein